MDLCRSRSRHSPEPGVKDGFSFRPSKDRLKCLEQRSTSPQRCQAQPDAFAQMIFALHQAARKTPRGHMSQADIAGKRTKKREAVPDKHRNSRNNEPIDQP